jgi:hypothetical protein
MSVLKLCQLSLVIVLSAAVFASAEEPEPKTLPEANRRPVFRSRG